MEKIVLVEISLEKKSFYNADR